LPAESLDLKTAFKIMSKLKAVDVSKRIYAFDCAYDPEKEVLAEIDAKGSILQNSNSTENLSDKFSSSN
jgi:hypothetical protein